MTPEAWIAAAISILTALGVREMVPGIAAWFTGRQDRQKTRVEALIDERDKAEGEAEGESQDRRKMAEYASLLRIRLISAGVPMHEIPPFPEIGKWRKPHEHEDEIPG